MSKQRLLVIGFFGLLVVPVVLILAIIPGLRRANESEKCLRKIETLAAAGKVWAERHGGKFPESFLAMTNQIISPAFLICPKDRYRQAAPNWDYFSPVRSSYIIAGPALEITDTNHPVVRCASHGYLGYIDGTVFDGTRRRRIQ